MSCLRARSVQPTVTGKFNLKQSALCRQYSNMELRWAKYKQSFIIFMNKNQQKEQQFSHTGSVSRPHTDSYEAVDNGVLSGFWRTNRYLTMPIVDFQFVRINLRVFDADDSHHEQNNCSKFENYTKTYWPKFNCDPMVMGTVYISISTTMVYNTVMTSWYPTVFFLHYSTGN